MADSEIDESDNHGSSGSDKGVEIIVNKKRIRRTKKITKGLAEDSISEDSDSWSSNDPAQGSCVRKRVRRTARLVEGFQSDTSGCSKSSEGSSSKSSEGPNHLEGSDLLVSTNSESSPQKSPRKAANKTASARVRRTISVKKRTVTNFVQVFENEDSLMDSEHDPTSAAQLQPRLNKGTGFLEDVNHQDSDEGNRDDSVHEVEPVAKNYTGI